MACADLHYPGLQVVRRNNRSVRPSGSVTLHVNRQDLYTSGMSLLQKLQPNELQARTIKIHFRRELGQDCGGPRREFFSQFASAIADVTRPDALFSYAPDNTLIPKPVSEGMGPLCLAVGRGNWGLDWGCAE